VVEKAAERKLPPAMAVNPPFSLFLNGTCRRFIMRRIILVAAAILAVFFLSFNVNAFEDETHRECLNSTHLFIENNYWLDGEYYQNNQTRECVSGCSPVSVRCNDDFSTQDNIFILSIIIIISVIVISMTYISINLDKKHSILGWYFLPFTLVTMIVGVFIISVNVVNDAARNMLNGVGFGLIITLILLIFYLILFIVTKGFEKLFNKNKDNYGDTLGGG
jgi:magnesium-transporting ATPase (P-type)